MLLFLLPARLSRQCEDWSQKVGRIAFRLFPFTRVLLCLASCKSSSKLNLLVSFSTSAGLPMSLRVRASG